MKKLAILFMMLALAIITAPVAAQGHATVGERIDLAFGPEVTTYPAGTPFHIQHGWVNDHPAAGAFNWGHARFELDIDGEPVHWTYRDVEVTSDYKRVTYITNFPDGMSGVHELTGHWLLKCSDAIELFGAECSPPGSLHEVFTRTVTVTFTE